MWTFWINHPLPFFILILSFGLSYWGQVAEPGVLGLTGSRSAPDTSDHGLSWQAITRNVREVTVSDRICLQDSHNVCVPFQQFIERLRCLLDFYPAVSPHLETHPKYTLLPFPQFHLTSAMVAWLWDVKLSRKANSQVWSHTLFCCPSPCHLGWAALHLVSVQPRLLLIIPSVTSLVLSRLTGCFRTCVQFPVFYSIVILKLTPMEATFQVCWREGVLLFLQWKVGQFTNKTKGRKVLQVANSCRQSKTWFIPGWAHWLQTVLGLWMREELCYVIGPPSVSPFSEYSMCPVLHSCLWNQLSRGLAFFHFLIISRILS